MKKIFKAFIFLAYATMCTVSFAHDNLIEIYGLDIPGLHQKDGGGIYDKVLTKIAEKGVKGTLSVLPLKRAERLLETCASCCLTPANKSPEFYDYGDEYITSDSMFTAKVFAWTLPEVPIISSIEGLMDKKVGGRLGMIYGKNIDNSSIELDLVPNIETNIKKLKLKRIDAFIAYTPDVFTAFEEIGKDIYNYAIDKPLAVHHDQIICKKSPETEAFVQKFNHELAVMRKDGTLTQIVGEQN